MTSFRRGDKELPAGSPYMHAGCKNPSGADAKFEFPAMAHLALPPGWIGGLACVRGVSLQLRGIWIWGVARSARVHVHAALLLLARPAAQLNLGDAATTLSRVWVVD